MSLVQIRKNSPLAHCITNIVVANFQANGLLAIGASPIMADDPEEVNEMVKIADCISLNIGTLNSQSKKAIIKAGVEANNQKKPVVLDPVGVGASEYRKKYIEEFLSNVKPSAIRCNAGELATIAKVKWEQKGVDSGSGDVDLLKVAKDMAIKYSCIFAVTGKEDIITDGNQYAIIQGGSALTPQITGSGCLLSAIVAASLTGNDDWFNAIKTTLQDYKKAAFLAEKNSKFVGDFMINFLNSLQAISLSKDI